jgi:hypothetical protein
MKKRNHFLFASALVALTTAGYAQTTYTWAGGADAPFGAAASWSPTRDTPATTDILSFPTGTFIVRDIPATQTVGKLILAENTTVTLYPTAGTNAVLRLSAAANDVLQIPATSALIFSAAAASTSVTIRADSADARATINGRITFTADGAFTTVAHRLIGFANTDSFVFANGSSFEFAARATGWGNPFSNVANSIRFAAGSTYYQGGTATANSPGTGSNPFNTATPVVAYDAGSTFYNWTSVYSTAARTYGNLIIDNRGSATSPFGATGLTDPTVINGDITWKAGAAAAVNIVAAAAPANPVMVVTGNWTVEPNGRFQDLYAVATDNEVRVGGNISIAGPNVVFNATGQRIWVLNGTAAQTVTIDPTLTIYGLKVDNAAGATLGGDLNVRGVVNLAQGNLTTGANTLNLAAGATVTGTGQIIGNVARSVDATVTGVRTFPVGANPVSIDITTAGTGTGSIAVGTAAGVGANLPGDVVGVARTWTITPTGISGGTYTVTFTYSDGELNGASEAGLKAARFNGSTWDVLGATSTVDTVANTVTVTGVTDFSTWTLVADAPASVPAWDTYDN